MNIDVARLLIEDAEADLITGIFSEAGRESTGAAGSVRVHGRDLEVRDGGFIASSNFGFGPAGDVLLIGDTILVSGANIETEGFAAEGGRIAISAHGLIHLTGAAVTSNGIVPRTGDSIITMQAPIIVVNSSEVTSLTGEGVPIVGSGEAVLDGDLTVISNDSTVEATSRLEIGGLESDVTAGIEVLPGAFLDVSGQLRESCGARRSGLGSSFVQTGDGRGLAPEPDGFLPGTYAGLGSSTLAGASVKGAAFLDLTSGCEG